MSRIETTRQVMAPELRDRSQEPAALGMIGESAALASVYERARLVAQAPNTTVLIVGESGVGKELAARAVHALSARRDAPFVAVNCAAINESLLESELFGYERGAFTGASQRKIGIFEAAQHGTILLDEVGEMGPGLQAKLLRVLQERRLYRVGGVRPVELDVRVIACTNRDLRLSVQEGSFRQDLFYRLNVVQIEIPPLREREGDVVPLAKAFLGQFAEEMRKDLRGFSRAALERLIDYPWPGNVRELRNTIERVAVLTPGPVVGPEDLQFSPVFGPQQDLDPSASDEQTLAEVERAHITRTLSDCHGNKSRAARLLGIHRTTLAKKIEEYGLG
ncbi:MAG: sigma-54-dependent Fis family transcriptional regulator [Planctomycetes bacterium]|nr:sigma-54-dependent Fis family transcriptional regulator [Planctomycetota bacterium]